MKLKLSFEINILRKDIDLQEYEQELELQIKDLEEESTDRFDNFEFEVRK